MDTKDSVTLSRTGAVVDAIRIRLASRALTAGEKLPSIRGFAATMRVSPSTVVEAYDRLAAEGVIRSRPGSGFYVAGKAPPLALAGVEPRREREIDPLWVSRQSLDAGSATLRPGCGWLPPDWLPTDAIRRAIRALAKAEDAILTDYGATQGSRALRRLLARQFAAEGLEASPEQILLTSSGTQAIDLICRFLLQPGDAVLVDDPCYFNFQALLRAHRVTIVGVRYTPTGPDLALFEEALANHRPCLYITNSALHNPTGATLSPQKAHRILAAAAAHDLTIIEDDIFADFEPEPPHVWPCSTGCRASSASAASRRRCRPRSAAAISRHGPTGSTTSSTSRSRRISAGRTRWRPRSSAASSVTAAIASN